MEVKISFDTEKESIQDLKGLISALQDLINKREGKAPQPQQMSQPVQSQPQYSAPQQQSQPQYQYQSQPQQPAQSASPQTASGSRVVDYKDMSDILSKIAQGAKRL